MSPANTGPPLGPDPPPDAGFSSDPDPEPIHAALSRIAAWTERIPGRAHPLYAGVVSLLAHNGAVVGHQAAGYQVRYADGDGTELPPEQQEKTHTGTVFDIASMTKLFTSLAALQQAEDGTLHPDAPVAGYLPEFGVHGKESITIRQLLTHTSGLQSVVRLWELPPEQRIPHVLSLTPVNPPGTTYTYSDASMIVLGKLVEHAASAPLNEVVAKRITEPLGMSDTGYRPPESKRHRIAATEYQQEPPRGMVRGEPHDENAWSLGGVAGHAGIFSTAGDLAVLAQTLLDGGVRAGERILRERSVEAMLTDTNTAFPDHPHGLGFELNQRWYMAGLSGPRSAGHTGYTGTSMVLDPISRSVAILLTNRVHPSREWGSVTPARVTLARGLARFLAAHGRGARYR